MNAMANSVTSPRDASISNVMPGQRAVFAVTLGILMLMGIAMSLSSVMGKPINSLAAIFVVLAAITSTIAQSRQLPVQNVLLATGVIMVVATIVETFWCVLSDQAGNSLLARWPVPLLWVSALLNSRGVAKLVLRRRQYSARYGFEIMALTIALSEALFLAARPIAADAGSMSFEFASAAKFAVQITGWSFAASGILLFATPVLINKKPVRFPPDYQPLLLWISLMLFAIVGATLRHLWLPAAMEIVATLLVVFLAIHETRQPSTIVA